MLTKPAIADDTIITCLHDHFGLRIAHVTFLPIGASFAAFWLTKRDEIQGMVEHAEQLAQTLQKRAVEPVVCHSDLHGRNVLVGTDNEVAIVDWDEPIPAPKERDLMFIGGGIGGIWNN